MIMRWDVINALLERTEGRRYLEIGVQHGDCGARVRGAREKWGVDPAPKRECVPHYHHLRKQKSDAFFASLTTERFDVVLVDGLHHAPQVLRDAKNSLNFLASDGFVVMHDCNPKSEEAQRVPREVRQWNGDCWKAMVRIREREDVDAFTIDSDHGIGVLMKRPNTHRLTEVPPKLHYPDLVEHRDRFLRLVPPDSWVTALEP